MKFKVIPNKPKLKEHLVLNPEKSESESILDSLSEELKQLLEDLYNLESFTIKDKIFDYLEFYADMFLDDNFLEDLYERHAIERISTGEDGIDTCRAIQDKEKFIAGCISCLLEGGITSNKIANMFNYYSLDDPPMLLELLSKYPAVVKKETYTAYEVKDSEKALDIIRLFLEKHRKES